MDDLDVAGVAHVANTNIDQSQLVSAYWLLIIIDQESSWKVMEVSVCNEMFSLRLHQLGICSCSRVSQTLS